MRDAGDCCEHVAVCVNDILTALKNPKEFCQALRSEPFDCILKNAEEPKCHLGGVQDMQTASQLQTPLAKRTAN